MVYININIKLGYICLFWEEGFYGNMLVWLVSIGIEEKFFFGRLRVESLCGRVSGVFWGENWGESILFIKGIL